MRWKVKLGSSGRHGKQSEFDGYLGLHARLQWRRMDGQYRPESGVDQG